MKWGHFSEHLIKKINKMKRTKHGRGPAIAMGLA
jgi:hypothetical protein